MKSSIAKLKAQETATLKLFMADSVELLRAKLPKDFDLEATARETKALQRAREIQTGLDLLRLALVYAGRDWSLRLVGLWCTLAQVGHLSDVAVLKRLRHCRRWLGKLIFATLQQQRLQFGQRGGVRVRLMDATSLREPGGIGTDWRLHLSFDLEAASVDGVTLTDATVGESFAHLTSTATEIRLGDRGYAYPRSLGAVLQAHGMLVVRISWQNLPLESTDGQKLNLVEVLRYSDANQAVTEQSVWLPTPMGRFPMRWIIAPLPQAASEKARAALRRKQQKHGKTPSHEALLAAGFVLLLSNLPADRWPTAEIVRLYRFRWQIELAFKRFKSLIHLDQIRAHSAELTQVYLLAKLFIVLLIENVIQQLQTYAATVWQKVDRPLSLWRVTALLLESLLQQLLGKLNLDFLLTTPEQATRFLCDTPRKRVQQLAQARDFLANYAPCPSSLS